VCQTAKLRILESTIFGIRRMIHCDALSKGERRSEGGEKKANVTKGGCLDAATRREKVKWELEEKRHKRPRPGDKEGV